MMLDLSQIYTQRLADLAKKLTNTDANCPACNHNLPKFPKRSITCKNCSSKLYVAYNLINDKTVLVQSENASVLSNLIEAHERYINSCRILGHTLAEDISQPNMVDKYWRELNQLASNPNLSIDEALEIQYKMFILLCNEYRYSAAFERLPAILSLEFGKEVKDRIDSGTPFLSYGTNIFDMLVIRRLVEPSDMEYLKILFTNPAYKGRYNYFFTLAGFDGELIWEGFKTEYELPLGTQSSYFKYLHTHVMGTKQKNSPEKISLLSKIKNVFGSTKI